MVSCIRNKLTFIQDFWSVTKNLQAKLNELEEWEKAPGGSEGEDHIYGLKKEITELLLREEVMWRVETAVQSAMASRRDKNTKNFHACASQRRRKNIIEDIKHSNGVWVSQDQGIADVALRYFQDIFSTSTPSTGTISEVLEQVPRKVSVEINRILGRSEEVHMVLSQMGQQQRLVLMGCPLCFSKLSGLRLEIQ